MRTKHLANFTLSKFKDVRAHCYCASLLRTHIHMPRHASSAPLFFSETDFIYDLYMGHRLLPSCDCKVTETMVAKFELVL